MKLPWPERKFSHKKKRGGMMLGMAALTVLISITCSAVLLSSFETYRASAVGEWRLQVRAAAEGAAILLSANPEQPRAEERIGKTVVVFSAPVRTEQQKNRPGVNRLEVPFTVSVSGTGSETPYSRQYRALFQQSESGKYTWVRLERI